MRTRLALFLLSGVLVFGCTQQTDESQTPRRSQFVEFVPTQLVADNLEQNVPADGPRVHVVKLEEPYCPPDLLVNGEDFVRFVNLSPKDSVEITGLDNPGRSISGDATDVGRLSKGKDRIVIPRSTGKRKRSESFEVNINPLKDQALVFYYNVLYDQNPCTARPDGVQRLWSVPPSMIVGPDTL